MNEKIQLIASIFGLNLKMGLNVQYKSYTESGIKISNIFSISQVEYLDENGEKRIDRLINHNTFQNINLIYKPEENIENVSAYQDNLTPEKDFNNDFSKYRILYDQKEHLSLDNRMFLDKKAEKFNKKEENDYLFRDATFSLSFIDYCLLKILKLTRIGSFKIIFSYTEFDYIPIFLQLLFHVPLLLTAIIILLIVFTFDPEVNKNIVKKEIERLPIQRYDTDLGFSDCSVCIERFKNKEEVKILPCNHCFHKDCIDSWLLNSLRCPICRSSVSKLVDTPSYEIFQNNYFI